MEGVMLRSRRRMRFWIVTALALCASPMIYDLLRPAPSSDDALFELPQSLWPQVMGQAREALSAGDYQFLPNRRSIWVFNRSNGRIVNYRFERNEAMTVHQSRVGQIDLTAFPLEDMVVLLSDRNLSGVLWVCNRRTGDVQLWELDQRDSELRPVGPIATSANLSGSP